MKNITVNYGLQTATRSVSNDATYRSILADSNLRALFGYGDNIRCLVSGVAVSMDTIAPANSTVVIETAANTKAAPDMVTIRYGLQSLTKDFECDTTIGEIVDDFNVRAFFGYGDNIRCLVSGVVVQKTSYTSEGMVITVETAANTKAS